ncbi:Type II secretion system protein D precursor [Shimia sp. SK013]|uniref:secretin N-terminal domain-containing protein n=1 Tax=Shimia sp. SK013 TaxID=1389006 RepID=UPI0006B59C21|nr:secretin N-terminal domain-containing protein [Shimia sp. SK013]KPA19804.1 Type II secretion system protein D precursor [Shimia sp. SK013]
MFRLPIRTLALAFALALTQMTLTAPPASAQVELDLRDADLRSFVQIVSEATNRNFVLDPQVRGTVTVLAPQGLAPDALYEVFLSVLELNRLTVVDGGAVTRIVPMNVARELADGSALPTDSAGYETRVIKINHASLDEVITVIRPLLPSEAVITPVPGAGLLILSDRGKNHRRISNLIARLDQPREDTIELIRLNNANAAEMVGVIEGMGLLRGGATISVDRRSNALIVSGSDDVRHTIRALATKLDQRGTVTVSSVQQLNYADASALADVVLRSFSDQTDQGQLVRVVPEPQTNALLITAPRDVMTDITAMVRHLDRRPTQVLVEAVIFELSVEGYSDLTSQFAGVINNAIVGGVQFSLEGRPSLTSLISAAVNGDVVNPGDGGIIGGGNQSGDNAFFGFISALASTSSVRLLSTPSIMTLNNQEAEIVVAQNVPFVTGTYTSTGTSSNPENPFQTIERRDVGLTLNVTPQINADKTVRLLIKQEVSNLTRQASAAGGEITARRALSTTVLVRDGNVIMLGGLLENESGATSQKVPGLSNIPLVGGLFRGKNATKNQSVLLVMLRPRVISTEAEGQRITKKAAKDARKASLALQPADSHLYPNTPNASFPFDGADLNQPFDAGFLDDVAQSRNLPPLPTRLTFKN